MNLGDGYTWDDPLEEGTATHCSILAQKISWAEKPWSIGSQRVRHDLSDLAQRGSTDKSLNLNDGYTREKSSFHSLYLSAFDTVHYKQLK